MNGKDNTPVDRARAAASVRRVVGGALTAGLAIVGMLAIGDAVSSFASQESPNDMWWLDFALGAVGIAATVAAVVIFVRMARRRRGDEVDRPRLPALDSAVLVATVQRVGQANFPIEDGYQSIPEIHVTVAGPDGTWDAVIGDLLEHPEAQGFAPGTSWKVNAFPEDRHWVALAPEHDSIRRLGFWMPDLADADERHSGGLSAPGHTGPGSDIRYAAGAEG